LPVPPIKVNRRRFLGCSAAAGWALSQGVPLEAGAAQPVRLGMIGLGNRGTTLLRAALELPGVDVAAVCDIEPRHRQRACGIVERICKVRPDSLDESGRVLERTDVEAVVVALPCDLHVDVYSAAIRAGKHLYAEKPLAATIEGCDRLIAEAARAPELAFHVGFQRRSNPRYQEGVALVRRGELGTLIEGRAAWVSSNGPVNGHAGWLAQRARSGDWMVEQAVHVWDVFGWVRGSLPTRVFAQGRRDVFAGVQPDRDVTDHYTALLEWPGGFHASLVHSWIDPADDAFTGMSQKLIGTSGGLDFGSGVATFRGKDQPRRTLHAGQPNDTRLALEAFIAAVRSPEPVPPPLSLDDARAATATGLMVRQSLDLGRAVTIDDVV
jgi:predicted dehydrogenase